VAGAHRQALSGATSCCRSGCLTLPGGACLTRARLRGKRRGRSPGGGQPYAPRSLSAHPTHGQARPRSTSQPRKETSRPTRRISYEQQAPPRPASRHRCGHRTAVAQTSRGVCASHRSFILASESDRCSSWLRISQYWGLGGRAQKALRRNPPQKEKPVSQFTSRGIVHHVDSTVSCPDCGRRVRTGTVIAEGPDTTGAGQRMVVVSFRPSNPRMPTSGVKCACPPKRLPGRMSASRRGGPATRADPRSCGQRSRRDAPGAQPR
jgi:hypothetical protein